MEPLKLENAQIWGLTGGIGSGKSLAARFFQEQGLSVINLDSLGKEILDSDNQVHEELTRLFGNSILVRQTPDRAKIREIVFNEAEKREALEKLLHPRIWSKFESKAKKAEQEGAKLILCEAALLIEHHHANLFPRLIVILANTELRKQRVHQRDKMDFSLIEAVLKSQTTDEERKRLATDILINEGTTQTLKADVYRLVTQWKQQNLF
jgi:dephospho-CoA kinase